MNELKSVQEYINTGLGTEGSLLILKKIADTLIEEVDKNLLPRELAAMVFTPDMIPGSSLDVNLATPDTLAVRLVAEGAEIPLDASEYSSFNIKPDKYGVAVRITTEMLEDSMFPLLERDVRLAGKRLAENETSLVISQALDNAANTVAGGATVTIANITQARQNLRGSDYSPTDFIIGDAVLNDLENIDTFVEADKRGNSEVLDRGVIGVIYGMKVYHVSSNAGMTNTSAYVIDRQHAYVIAEKRRVTVENFKLETFDMTGAVVTQRIRARHLRAQAICKITSS